MGTGDPAVGHSGSGASLIFTVRAVFPLQRQCVEQLGTSPSCGFIFSAAPGCTALPRGAGGWQVPGPPAGLTPAGGRGGAQTPVIKGGAQGEALSFPPVLALSPAPSASVTLI